MQLSLLPLCSLSLMLSQAFTPLHGCTASISEQRSITIRSIEGEECIVPASVIKACSTIKDHVISSETFRVVMPHFVLIGEFYSIKGLLKELCEEENYLKLRSAVEKAKYPVTLDSPVMRHYLLCMSDARFNMLQQKYASTSSEERKASWQETQETIKVVMQKDTQVLQRMDALERGFDFHGCAAFVKSLEALLITQFMDVFICQMTHSYQLRMGLLDRVKEIKREHGSPF